jgi:hypothetical protein
MLTAFGICRGDRADFLFDSTALPPGITGALFSIASSGVFGRPKDCPVCNGWPIVYIGFLGGGSGPDYPLT